MPAARLPKYRETLVIVVSLVTMLAIRPAKTILCRNTRLLEEEIHSYGLRDERTNIENKLEEYRFSKNCSDKADESMKSPRPTRSIEI